jgi:hypothetical protein
MEERRLANQTLDQYEMQLVVLSLIQKIRFLEVCALDQLGCLLPEQVQKFQMDV